MATALSVIVNMPFEPSARDTQRVDRSSCQHIERRFYDPGSTSTLPLRDILKREEPRLLATSVFTRDLNGALAQLERISDEFGHESERRVGLWKAIQCSFHRWKAGGCFRTSCPTVTPTAAVYGPVHGLLAVDGTTVDDSDIPRFRPTTGNVKVTFQNPAGPTQTFEFAPAAKQDDSNTRFVTHKLLEPASATSA